MKKYFYIYKFELMSNLNYIFNNVVSFLGYLMIIYVFYNLWKYIYSNPSELINGYSMNDMIWYVSITELLWSISGGRGLCKKIANDVKGGNIAYNLNKPYSYINYSLASYLGSITIKSIIYTILSLLLGYLLIGNFPSISFIGILVTFVSCLFSIIIGTLINIFIGLFSFIVEDSNPFYWLYSKLILILGTMFPIEFFPLWAQRILNYSPIFVLSYGPARLFVQYNDVLVFRVIIVQLLYLIFAYVICLLMYRKGVRKLNANGG